MKVNIWERDKQVWDKGAAGENGNHRDSVDYLYQNYRPVKSSFRYRKPFWKWNRENRWILQLLVSGLIIAAVLGLFKFDIPFGEALRSGVRYLMTTETDVAPAFYKIVHLAAQTANVEWPLVDDVPQPVTKTVTEAPAGTVLLLPVSGNVIRPYGWIIDPEEKVEKFHEGIDIAVPVGTEVKASADGKVVKTGEKEGLGKFILVKNNSGELVRYANLDKILVKEGRTVKAEDIIATSGVERDREPHVHFEVIVNGRPTDPLTRMGVDFTRISVPAEN